MTEKMIVASVNVEIPSGWELAEEFMRPPKPGEHFIIFGSMRLCGENGSYSGNYPIIRPVKESKPEGNDMAPSEMAEVMLKAERGMAIQKTCWHHEKWEDDPKPIWNWAYYRYRVKPKPEVFWLNVYDECVIRHLSRSSADKDGTHRRIACIRVPYTPGQFDEPLEGEE